MRSFWETCTENWRCYWFAPAGVSLGIARIAVFAAILLTYHRVAKPDYEIYLASQGPDLYRPIGLLKCFPDSPPSAAFFEACKVAALVFTWLAIVGCCTRASMVVSVLANIVLASAKWSWADHWCHGNNIPLLAGMALMFAPAGLTLSVDAAIRKRSGWGPTEGPGSAYSVALIWPVLLAQFSVAFMFANAFYWKMISGGPHWVFSDNLRNSLGLAWYPRGGPPAHVSWIMSHEWAWKVLALGNVVSQILPLAACLLIGRPKWRFFFGLFYVAEILGLGFVVGLWHLEWLPLFFLFVDWDKLWTWIRAKSGNLPTIQATWSSANSGWSGGRFTRWAASAYIVAFSGYYVYTGLTAADKRHRNYPFSSFAMYSAVRAQSPYYRHLPYEYVGYRIEVVSDPPVSSAVQRRIAKRYKNKGSFGEGNRLRRQAAAVMNYLRASCKVRGLESVAIHCVVWQIPAYPEHHAPVAARTIFLGSMDTAGTFSSTTNLARGGRQPDIQQR